MYHIFLSLVLIVAQNQIDHSKGYSWKQRNIVQEKEIIGNELETRNPEKKQDPPTELTDNIFGDDLGGEIKNELFDDQDIISQLKKVAEIEEKALAPDLESLGLDDLDFFEKSASEEEKNILAEDQENLDDEVKKEQKIVSQITKEQLEEKISTDLEEKVEVSEFPKSDKFPKELPKEEIVAVKKVEKEVTDPIKIKKVDPPKIVKNQEKTKEEEKSGFHPIAAIKNFFKKDPEPIADVKKIVSKKDEDVIKDDKIVIDPQIQLDAEIEERKKREKRIALEEAKERQRMEKMQNIREKYLQQNEENTFDGISNYQIMSQIVPRKKILPKFINTEVPPPLLNRIRSNENRHHPFMMSNGEKVDFMFKAIAKNRIDEFNSLYALNKEPNIKNHFGDTLLTFSAVMGRRDAISSLLSKGADPDMVNDLGYSPLSIAIELVDYLSVELLVEMGARIDTVDGLGRTYLMQATRVGSLQIVDLLLSKGVEINAEDNSGNTALTMAFKYKKDIIAKYLARFGAKSFIKKEYKEDDSSMIEEIFYKWR
ncbi:MAG: ankyrin repeat protein [Rickettsiales bacterium]|jgi:ankyrin repeat protein